MSDQDMQPSKVMTDEEFTALMQKRKEERKKAQDKLMNTLKQQLEEQIQKVEEKEEDIDKLLFQKNKLEQEKAGLVQKQKDHEDQIKAMEDQYKKNLEIQKKQIQQQQDQIKEMDRSGKKLQSSMLSNMDQQANNILDQLKSLNQVFGKDQIDKVQFDKLVQSIQEIINDMEISNGVKFSIMKYGDDGVDDAMIERVINSSQIQQNNTGLKLDIAKYQSTIKSLETKLAKLQQENDGLKLQVSQVNSLKGENMMLKARLAGLKQREKELENEIARDPDQVIQLRNKYTQTKLTAPKKLNCDQEEFKEIEGDAAYRINATTDGREIICIDDESVPLDQLIKEQQKAMEQINQVAKDEKLAHQIQESEINKVETIKEDRKQFGLSASSLQYAERKRDLKLTMKRKVKEYRQMEIKNKKNKIIRHKQKKVDEKCFIRQEWDQTKFYNDIPLTADEIKTIKQQKGLDEICDIEQFIDQYGGLSNYDEVEKMVDEKCMTDILDLCKLAMDQKQYNELVQKELEDSLSAGVLAKEEVFCLLYQQYQPIVGNQTNWTNQQYVMFIQNLYMCIGQWGDKVMGAQFKSVLGEIEKTKVYNQDGNRQVATLFGREPLRAFLHHEIPVYTFNDYVYYDFRACFNKVRIMNEIDSAISSINKPNYKLNKRFVFNPVQLVLFKQDLLAKFGQIKGNKFVFGTTSDYQFKYCIGIVPKSFMQATSTLTKNMTEEQRIAREARAVEQKVGDKRSKTTKGVDQSKTVDEAKKSTDEKKKESIQE